MWEFDTRIINRRKKIIDEESGSEIEAGEWLRENDDKPSHK